MRLWRKVKIWLPEQKRLQLPPKVYQCHHVIFFCYSHFRGKRFPENPLITVLYFFLAQIYQDGQKVCNFIINCTVISIDSYTSKEKELWKLLKSPKCPSPPPQINMETEEKVKGKKLLLWANWQHPSTTEGAKCMRREVCQIDSLSSSHLLTFSGCWAPWCLHTCSRYSKCKMGSFPWSTPGA